MPEIRFRVVSTHPRVSSAQLVSQLSTCAAGLTRHLRKQGPPFGQLSVEAEREKSVPIDPVTGYLVLKFIGAGLAGAAVKKAFDEAYDYLKSRIKNGTIARPVKQGSRRTAKKKSKAKRTKQAKR